MGRFDCIFVDSPNQFITKKSLNDPSFVQISHDGWFIKIPLKEINQIKAAHATSVLLSPYSFLYEQYRVIKDEHALYALALEENIFLAVFKDNEPLFTKSFNIENAIDLQKIIEQFLHQFYEKEGSFFIEKVYIFYQDSGFYEDHDLSEKLLLDVRYERIDMDKICSDTKISAYFVPFKKIEKKSINNKFITAVGLAILLFLLGYDIYLRYSSAQLKKRLHAIIASQVATANQNNADKVEILKVNAIRPVVQRLKESNEYLSGYIHNLFELVADDTYLTKLELDRDSLIIEGVAKRKESFEKLHKSLAKNFQKSNFTIKKRGKALYFTGVYENPKDEDTNADIIR